MSDSESLSLSDSDNFFSNRKLSNITAPANILRDVIDSDDENPMDISKHGTHDRTIAGNENEYRSRWRKRKMSPIRGHRTYKERIHEHFEELEKDQEKKEQIQQEREEKQRRTKEKHRQQRRDLIHTENERDKQHSNDYERHEKRYRSKSRSRSRRRRHHSHNYSDD
ncbi:Uncharacterized protein QTN25_004518 [Entamoeba marina]